MDKYEYRLKTDHIRQVAARKDYQAAAKLCDTIDWNKVRDVKMLTTVADIYTAVERYQEAIDALIQAYDYAPIGRRIVYRLTELALEADSYEDANEYFDEFCRIAPHDQGRYILLYKMACSQHATVAEKIKILEAYKREDFDEKWAYELATLYARNRQVDQCTQLCDDIILWFGLGKYVEKALALKARYAPLTDEQKAKAKKIQDQRDTQQYEARKEAIREIQGVPDTVDDLKVDSELDEVGKVTAAAVRSIEKEAARQEAAGIPIPQFKKAPEVHVTRLDGGKKDTSFEKKYEKAVSGTSRKLSRLVADNQKRSKETVPVDYPEDQIQQIREEFDASRVRVQEGPVSGQVIEQMMEEGTHQAKDDETPTRTGFSGQVTEDTRTDIWPDGAALQEEQRREDSEPLQDDRLYEEAGFGEDYGYDTAEEYYEEAVPEPIIVDSRPDIYEESDSGDGVVGRAEADTSGDDTEEELQEGNFAAADEYGEEEEDLYEPGNVEYGVRDGDTEFDEYDDDGYSEPEEYEEDEYSESEYEEYEEAEYSEPEEYEEDEYSEEEEYEEDEYSEPEEYEEDEYLEAEEEDYEEAEYSEPEEPEGDEYLEPEEYEEDEYSEPEEYEEDEYLEPEEYEEDEYSEPEYEEYEEAEYSEPEEYEEDGYSEPEEYEEDEYSGPEEYEEDEYSEPEEYEEDEYSEPEEYEEDEYSEPEEQEEDEYSEEEEYEEDEYLEPEEAEEDEYSEPEEPEEDEYSEPEEPEEDEYLEPEEAEADEYLEPEEPEEDEYLEPEEAEADEYLEPEEAEEDEYLEPEEAEEDEYLESEADAGAFKSEKMEEDGPAEELRHETEEEVKPETEGVEEKASAETDEKEADGKEAENSLVPDEPKASGEVVQTEKEEETSASDDRINPQMNPTDLSKVWHFAVNVPEREDPMDTAKEYIRMVSEQTERPIPSNITSITGEQLNGKNLLQSFDSMLGKTIIILDAGEMEGRVINELTSVLEPSDRSVLVVIADTPFRIARLYTEYPQLKEIFDTQFMQIRFTASELIRYAQDYAERQDSVLDKSAELWLIDRTEEILKNPERDKQKLMEETINRAIEEAEKKSLKRSFTRLFSVRYDKEGRLILTDKHFK